MLPSRGRPGALLVFEIDRELTHQDVLRLAVEGAPKVGPPILQKLKDHHHAIARYLASGRSVVETAELTGMTPQRVGDLQRLDPAFQNLLSFYQEQVGAIGTDEARQFRGKLRGISTRSLDIITERLDDPDQVEKLSTDELRRLAEMGLDRTDAPPRTAQTTPPTPTQITFNMGPRTIEPKELKVVEGEEVETIDIESEGEDDDKGNDPV